MGETTQGMGNSCVHAGGRGGGERTEPWVRWRVEPFFHALGEAHCKLLASRTDSSSRRFQYRGKWYRHCWRHTLGTRGQQPRGVVHRYSFISPYYAGKTIAISWRYVGTTPRTVPTNCGIFRHDLVRWRRDKAILNENLVLLLPCA